MDLFLSTPDVLARPVECKHGQLVSVEESCVCQIGPVEAGTLYHGDFGQRLVAGA